MTTYDTYKPSGIEWIGDIPEHWEVKRLKYKISYQKGKNPKELKSTQTENSEIYLAMDYLRDSSKQVFYVENPEEYVIVNDNDILLLWDGSNAGEFIKSKKGVLSSTMAALTLNEIDKDYTFHYLKTFEKYLKESTIGMGIPHVNGEEFKNSLFVLPNINEQDDIATYLDRKTAEIDHIIANKQKLIALYEEEKQTIINQAVTRGVDKTVKLKPSGVEWMGNVPEHWKVNRLRHVTDMKSGDGITSENIKEVGEYPVFGGNGLRGYFDSFTHEGDYVLIGRQGALCGNINYATGKFWASEHAIVCTLKGNHITNWFGEVLRTMNLNQYSVSAAQPGLSIENLKALQLPVPPIDEQQTIVALIEEECSRLDNLIEKYKKQIELFQEYRTTLISEVVTGKIKVEE